MSFNQDEIETLDALCNTYLENMLDKEKYSYFTNTVRNCIIKLNEISKQKPKQFLQEDNKKRLHNCIKMLEEQSKEKSYKEKEYIRLTKSERIDLLHDLQKEVDEQTDGCEAFFTFDDDIKIEGGAMTIEEWIDFGKNLAHKVWQQTGLHYQTHGGSPTFVNLKRVANESEEHIEYVESIS